MKIRKKQVNSLLLKQRRCASYLRLNLIIFLKQMRVVSRGGEVVEMKVEVIISIAICISAIVGIIIMHRIAPEQKTYKIWAILDAVTITVLMYYNAIQ